MVFVKNKLLRIPAEAPAGIKIMSRKLIRFSASLTAELGNRKYVEIYFDDELKRIGLRFYISPALSQDVYKLYDQRGSRAYYFSCALAIKKLLEYGYTDAEFIPVALEDGMYVTPSKG